MELSYFHLCRIALAHDDCSSFSYIKQSPGTWFNDSMPTPGVEVMEIKMISCLVGLKEHKIRKSMTPS